MVKLPGDFAPQGVDFEEDETRLPEPEPQRVAAPAPAPEPVAQAKPEPAKTPAPEEKEEDLLAELARLSGHEPIYKTPETPLMREMEPFAQRIMYDRQADVAIDESIAKAESAVREARAKPGARATAPQPGESGSIMGRAVDRIFGKSEDSPWLDKQFKASPEVKPRPFEKLVDEAEKFRDRYSNGYFGMGYLLPRPSQYRTPEEQKEWGQDQVKRHQARITRMAESVREVEQQIAAWQSRNPGQPVPDFYKNRLANRIAIQRKYTPEAESKIKSAQDIAAGKAPGPQLHPFEHYRRTVAQGAISTAASMVSSGGDWGNVIRGALGEDVDITDNQLRKWGNAIQTWGQEQFPNDPLLAEQFATQVAYGLGSASIFYGAGGAASLMGRLAAMSPAARAWFGTMTAAGLGAFAGSGEGIERAMKHVRKGGKLTNREAILAMTLTFGVGTLEAAPVLSWLRTKQGGNVFAGILEQSLEEAVQEGPVNTGLQNWVEQVLYNPDRNIMDDVVDNAMVGFATGGIMETAKVSVQPLMPGVEQPQPLVTEPPEGDREQPRSTPAPAAPAERTGVDAEAELPQATTTPTEPEELATRPRPEPARSADEVAENKQEVQGTPLAQPGGAAPPREIVTPDGSMKVPAEFKVVDLREMKPAEGEFQPRDTDRAERAIVARQIASNYDMELGTTPSRVSDRGPPIGYGDVVISGNTRLEAYQLIYNDPAFKATADKIRQHFGVTDPQAQPIPLASITGQMSREELVRFADLSNRSAIQQMNATERAQRDARAAGSDVMQLYQGGSFEAPQNREFLRAFVESATTPSERGSMARNGRLTLEGEQRLRNALLAASYQNADAIGRMVESRDDNARALSGAMLDVAGLVQQLKASIARGETDPQFDITPQITEAAQRISQMREDGVRPAEALAQQDAFERMDPVVESLIRGFYNESLTRPVSRKKMTELLTLYLTEAQKHSGNEGLIPDETTAEDVLQYARTAGADAAGDLLAGVDADGEGATGGPDAGDGRGDGRRRPQDGRPYARREGDALATALREIGIENDIVARARLDSAYRDTDAIEKIAPEDEITFRGLDDRGESVAITMPTVEALREADNRLAGFNALLKCMRSN